MILTDSIDTPWLTHIEVDGMTPCKTTFLYKGFSTSIVSESVLRMRANSRFQQVGMGSALDVEPKHLPHVLREAQFLLVSLQMPPPSCVGS